MQVRKWWLFTHLDEKHDRTETLPQVMVKYWSEKSHTFVCSQSIPCQRLPFMTDCRYILSSFKRLPLHLHYFITMPMLYNCFQIIYLDVYKTHHIKRDATWRCELCKGTPSASEVPFPVLIPMYVIAKHVFSQFQSSESALYRYKGRKHLIHNGQAP